MCIHVWDYCTLGSSFLKLYTAEETESGRDASASQALESILWGLHYMVSSRPFLDEARGVAKEVVRDVKVDLEVAKKFRDPVNEAVRK